MCAIITNRRGAFMKKILFTDLMGTLISPDLGLSKKYFGSFDRECSLLCQYINEFLKEDNYIAVVTEPGAHGRFGTVFNEQLVKLNSYIEDDLRSHIEYFLQGNGNIFPADNIVKENRNGKIFYIGRLSSFKGIAIDKKENAINDFLERMKRPYEIYGLGDSAKDIPMLLRVEEMGGRSAIIDTYLYRLEKTSKEIIDQQLDIEFSFLFDKVIEEKKSQYLKEGKLVNEMFYEYNEKELLLLQKREERKEELYQMISTGEFDLDDSNRKYSNFFLCEEYKMLNDPVWNRNNKFYENYLFSDNVVQNIMRMPAFHSFGDYYTKVLKK